MKKKQRKYWAGYVDGKLDDSGWRIGQRDDLSDLISVFAKRKTALKVFTDVRAVYIIPVRKPKRGAQGASNG